jgi:outer membrane protein OmpA-like peptidoglycan-associated protein
MLLLCQQAVPAQVLNRSGQDSTIYISGSVFLPSSPLAAGSETWALAAADFNGDSLPDIASASRPDGKLYLHFNRGGGNFAAAAPLSLRPNLRALCAADFDGNGSTDLALSSQTGDLLLLRNDGRGNFSLRQSFDFPAMFQDLQAGDLDGDGDADLLLAAVDKGQVWSFLNDGQGRFARGPSYASGREPRSLLLGDFDRDGFCDFACGCDDGRLYLYWNDRRGGFGRSDLRSALAGWSLASGDFNGDGLPDLAAASYLDVGLCIHLGARGRQFQREQARLSGDHNFALAAADFDLDGDLDLLTCSANDDALHFHLNDGKGQFSDGIKIKSGDWNAALGVADFDQDGDPDIVSGAVLDQRLHLHRNISAEQRQQSARMRTLPACLRGFVYDDNSGALLAGVPVSLHRADGSSVAATLSAADGSYALCPPSGSYELRARAPGFPPYRLVLRMPAQDSSHDIHLQRAEKGLLLVQVLDAADRSPLAGAVLRLRSAKGQLQDSLSADEAGKARWELPFDENYRILASHPGYHPHQVLADVLRSQPSGKKVLILLEKDLKGSRVCVAGTVRDEKSLTPLANAEVTAQQGPDTLFRFTTSPDGRFRACLPFGDYTFSAQASGYFFSTVEVQLPQRLAGQEVQQDLLLRPLEKDAAIVLKNIYFDVDKSSLRPESLAELDRLKTILLRHPDLLIAIEGHTDSDAPEAYNQQLSQRRAQAVVSHLQEAGIPASQMQAFGYGESRPVVPNSSAENKQLNRRTEFRVLEMGENRLAKP